MALLPRISTLRKHAAFGVFVFERMEYAVVMKLLVPKADYILNIHGAGRVPNPNILKVKVYSYLERFAITASFITNVVDPLRVREMKSSGLHNVRFLPTGFNGAYFKPAPSRAKKGTFRIGYSGRKSPEKRLDRIGRILRNISQEVDIVFYISGDATPQDFLLKKVNFEFCEVGYLSYERMHEFYEQIDCLLLASDFEGFPLCILESLACGRPVVAPAFPGILEISKTVPNLELISLDEIDSEDAYKGALLRTRQAMAEGLLDPQVLADAVSCYEKSNIATLLEKEFEELYGSRASRTAPDGK